MMTILPAPLAAPFELSASQVGLRAQDAQPEVPWGAVFIGAVALFGSIATIIYTARNADRQLAATRRSQWWERFAWATELVISNDVKRGQAVGLRVLRALLEDPQSRADDNKLALAIVNHVAHNRKPKHRRRW